MEAVLADGFVGRKRAAPAVLPRSGAMGKDLVPGEQDLLPAVSWVSRVMKLAPY